MRTLRLSLTGTVMLALVGGLSSVVVAQEAEPTAEPLARYEDPVGDVPGGIGPDFVACSVSEPWESLVSFSFEFASEPPLGYDLETMTTDELWVGVTAEADALFPDDFKHLVIVHGATLAEGAESGVPLYDTTQAEGDEVFWGVVDVNVDGATLTLNVDRKLVGDPEELYFLGLVVAEGQDDADVCPDAQRGPGEGEFRLVP
jgi:hypothetical protein